MTFHISHRTEFLHRSPTRDPAVLLGTAMRYAVQLQQATVSTDEQHWRVLGVHHLTPSENRGKHAVYADIVDEQGNRLRDPNIRLEWGWEGQRPDERTDPRHFDKPDNEPATNVDIYRGQYLWVRVIEGELSSDTVAHLHTNHDDEPGPNGELWNSLGHHSFYVLFQRTRQGEVITPPEEEEPEEEPNEDALDDATYVRDQIADGTPFYPGDRVEQRWVIRNSGTTTWGEAYHLAFECGIHFGNDEMIPVPTTAPEEETTLAVTFTAPQVPGRYRSHWRLRNGNGEWFGERFWLDIVVQAAEEEDDDSDQPDRVTIPGNKLGFYLHLSTDRDGMWNAVSRLQPPVILIHADTANKMLLEEIRRFRAPETFVIGRLYKDVNAQRQMLESGDPEGAGRAMAEEILRYDFGLATKRGDNDRLLIDAWMSLNEAVPGPNAQQFREEPERTARLLHNYDRFQVAFRNKLQEAGVEAVAFNFGAGNFQTAAHYLDHFPETLASHIYLGFHEYGWPTLYPAENTATSAGTYRQALEGIRDRYGNRHRVIITEAGLTRMYKNPAWGDVGWLNPEETLREETYWESLAWYNSHLLQDDYVLGACLFEVGHHGTWETFRHLGRDNQGNEIQLIDRMVALNEAARRGTKRSRSQTTRGQTIRGQRITVEAGPALPPLSIYGTVTAQGRRVAGATVRLIGGHETLGCARDAAAITDADITWTQTITGYSGTIWNAWRKFVAPTVAGITYAEFKELVPLYNTALTTTDGLFVVTESYVLPENPDTNEVIWDRPLTAFTGSLWDCWQQYVAHKVVGLDYHSFKKAVVVNNPQISATGNRFVEIERYNLPRNVAQSEYQLVTTTGGRGTFRFPDLPPGDYQLEVSATGYWPTYTGFSCQATLTLPVTLQPVVQPTARTQASRFVQVRGNEFVLQRQPFRFVGANIRGLVHYGDNRTLPAAPESHQLEQLRAAQAMGTRVVRVFLPSRYAPTEQTIEGLQSLIKLLKTTFPDVYLIPALTNLYADVPFHLAGDAPLYQGNVLVKEFFTTAYQDHYLPFVRDIVEAFRDEPQIFAWEIGNELKLDRANKSDEQDPNPYHYIDFIHTIAAFIRRLAPNHLITTGMISTRHAWLFNMEQKRRLYATPNLDFVTIHAYQGSNEEDDSPIARELNMPFIVEEAGFDAPRGVDRSPKVAADMDKWFGLGARGYMQWGFMATQDNGDGDRLSGMDRVFHSDWDALTQLYHSRAQVLAQVEDDWQPPLDEEDDDPITKGATVYTQTWLNIRKSPGHIGQLGDDILGMLPPGAAVTLKGDSVQKDELVWWLGASQFADGSLVQGWVAEAVADTVLLAPTPPPVTRAAKVEGEIAYAQTYLNLRRNPGYVGKPADHVIGQIPHGAQVRVLGGPKDADSLTWWRVRAPLIDNKVAMGWVAEADANEIRLLDGTAPAPPKEPETTAVPAVKTGSSVTVVGISINLRASPAINPAPDHVLTELSKGTRLRVLDGPKLVDGLAWLQVAGTVRSGQEVRGWAAMVAPNGVRLLAPSATVKSIQIARPFAERWAMTQGWGTWPEFYARFTYDGVPLKGHNGLDFATPMGTPLLAVADGSVKRVGFEPNGFGNFLLIQHKWGESLYAHLDRIEVAQGTQVQRGDAIGLSGKTGAGTGPHLHFGIRINPYRRTDGWGGFSDPTPFMDPTDLVRSRSTDRQPEPMAPELPGRPRP